MKSTSPIKILSLLLTLLFLCASCEKKKQNIVQKIDNTAEIKKILEKANAYHDLGKSDSGFFYFNKARLLCEPKVEYADDYVHSLLMMTEILQKNGDFYEAETTITKTLPYLEKTTQPKFSINAYTLIAHNYYYTFDNETALIYYRKALKKAVSTFRKSCVMSDIAFIYMQQKKYKEAIDLLKPLTKRNIIDKVDPPNTYVERGSKLYNLGLCYLRLGNHKDEALACFNESLELSLKSNTDYNLIPNYYAFYVYYKKYNNPVLKKINAQKAYDCAKRSKSIANQIITLENLIEADDAKNSKKHWEIYIRLTDSTINSRKIAKNQFAYIMYDSNKDKEENLELKSQKTENELQLQKQKNRTTISYVVISIILFALLFTVCYVTLKGKRERNDAVFKNEMRISEKLRNELEKDIHEVLLFAENNELENIESKEKFLSHLQNIYSKTRNISRENSEIITDVNFEKDLKEMISGYTTPKLNILVNGLDTFSWSKIDRVKKITIFRVIQQICEQAKMFSNASLASITFKKDEKKIVITYAANSTEIPDDINLNTRLTNIKNRLKSVKGFIEISSNQNQGVKFFIKLPL